MKRIAVVFAVAVSMSLGFSSLAQGGGGSRIDSSIEMKAGSEPASDMLLSPTGFTCTLKSRSQTEAVFTCEGAFTQPLSLEEARTRFDDALVDQGNNFHSFVTSPVFVRREDGKVTGVTDADIKVRLNSNN